MSESTLVPTRARGAVVDVRSLAEAMQFATMIASTDMVPEGDQGKPANILIKMQMGAELDIPPMQAIQHLYVIKGRAGMEVTLMLAKVEASGLLEKLHIDRQGVPGTATAKCIVTVQRKGRDPHVVEFGHKEAEVAGLTTGRNKDTYARWGWRMYQNRALGFALGDMFADVLRGLVTLEYLQDSGIRVGGDVDGRGVEGELLISANADLENRAVELMTQLGIRAGQRLAKLTGNRGRLPEFIAELEQQVAAMPPKPVAQRQLETAPVNTMPVQPRDAEVVDADLARMQDAVDVHAVPAPAADSPKCPHCGAVNYSNPSCDTCLDMQLAEA